MLATYGVDVLDPAMSLRRIHVLLERLPAGSFPATDHAAAWSTEAHLLAQLADQVAALTWVTLRAHGARPPRPRPLPRPGQKQGRAKIAWGQLASALSRDSGMVRDGG